MFARTCTFFLVSALTLTGLARAAPIVFTGTLSGANENPPTNSNGSGSALVTFDPSTNLLTVGVIFAGLTSGTTASHIHCCVAPNGNAGIATAVPTFPGFPLGVTFGFYTNSFDMTLASSYNPAFVTANGGTVASAESAFVGGLEGGRSYLNVHTTNNPGGEIRAFLLQPVPEPGSALPVILGLGALWAMRRRTTPGSKVSE